MRRESQCRCRCVCVCNVPMQALCNRVTHLFMRAFICIRMWLCIWDAIEIKDARPWRNESGCIGMHGLWPLQVARGPVFADMPYNVNGLLLLSFLLIRFFVLNWCVMIMNFARFVCQHWRRYNVIGYASAAQFSNLFRCDKIFTCWHKRRIRFT